MGKSAASSTTHTEGSGYVAFQRVRMMDNQGFTEPAEAYSVLLPKGWKHRAEIVWTMPGNACAGNNAWLEASSPDNGYSLRFLPNVILSWNTNAQLMQWNMSQPASSLYCGFSQPIGAVGAEQYLRVQFVRELGSGVEKTKAELMQYGAAGVRGFSSAVNADVRWSDGTEGLVTLGALVVETLVPNIYNGSQDKLFTTSIVKRTVFRYLAGARNAAASRFAVILSYHDAVNGFWRQVRQESNRRHWEKIRLMDRETQRIGENAIRQGNQRLRDMDYQMRSWEARQSSQDRMHTEFIKTIREVENFRDETGKYEMTSGYDHAWSRGDGTSFVLSDDPNFDAASVFQDQAWKRMKKVP